MAGEHDDRVDADGGLIGDPGAENRSGEKQLMEMIGSKSPYYARQIQNAARRVPLSWLRKAASLCAETDAALKGGAADRQKQIELTLLTMAAELKGEKK